ncbi:MAG: hypothetical protein EXS05_24095 [Planctomycetaceae bacterium]|nr:hypothetical protein [Planctomycetaceae bacterium]
MTPLDTLNGTATKNRFRLPGLEREGIAQLSILETALWPLRGGKLSGSTFDTDYSYTSKSGREAARVSVFSPDGLQPNDEYILWGLLGLSLDRPNPESTLLATPYWIIQKLGMSIGGKQYDQLRGSLERLAMVAYQNTGFYNPVTQQHERITLHFFSTFLPTRGRGGDVDTDRVWRIEWDKHFFALCQATGGKLLFDLDLYRELTPAARRLFLKLQDRFWRYKRVFMEVDDLTINGLGFSADRPLYKRKFDLTQCIRELLDRQIIELGRGQTDPSELFLKRGRGSYVAVFYEGAYFRRPHSERTTGQKNAIAADPLFEPLQKIGVDQQGIRRLFKEFSRGLIQRWIRITDTAMHENPKGFTGFKSSPAAFLIDGIQNERGAPDWLYAHEKRRETED